MHNFDPLWRVRARSEGRLRQGEKADKTGQQARLSRGEALRAWGRIADALAASESSEDRHLAHEIRGFVQRQPVVQAVLQQRQGEAASRPDPAPQRGRSGLEIGR